ncbi:MAG: hypothetical protein ABIH39_05290 [Candidatus Margulisiibacteriota bacterium]
MLRKIISSDSIFNLTPYQARQQLEADIETLIDNKGNSAIPYTNFYNKYPLCQTETYSILFNAIKNKTTLLQDAVDTIIAELIFEDKLEPLTQPILFLLNDYKDDGVSVPTLNFINKIEKELFKASGFIALGAYTSKRVLAKQDLLNAYRFLASSVIDPLITSISRSKPVSPKAKNTMLLELRRSTAGDKKVIDMFGPIIEKHSRSNSPADNGTGMIKRLFGWIN